MVAFLLQHVVRNHTGDDDAEGYADKDTEEADVGIAAALFTMRD